VGSVKIAFQEENTGSEPGWRKAARLNGVRINRVSAGDVLSIDHSMKLYFLSPGNSSQKAGRVRIRSANNSSIVVLLRTTHSSVLFTGDAERLQERELIARYGDLLRSEVVKVAHHGSFTSSIRLFVERVIIPDKTVAVISSGLNNRFGHPSTLVVARWTKSGSKVLLTSEQGAVSFMLDGGRIVRQVR